MRFEGIEPGRSGVAKLITLEPGSYQITCAGAKGGAGTGDKSIASCLGGFGATLKGTFTTETKCELIVLPGNAGTDNPQVTANGTTGAGGGGTYIALVVESTYPEALLTSGFENTECNDKYVIPLMVAAGGNGGRDYAYSGDGEVYHGVHTTHEAFVSGTYQGGSFAALTVVGSNNGTNFISGGAAATANYTRSGNTSLPGFGGGGANKDNTTGGGGGGYYGGHVTLSACSYYEKTLISNFEGTTGSNQGMGYIEITELTPTGPLESYGEVIFELPMLQEFPELDSIIIKDFRVVPSGAELKTYISQNGGTWKEISPDLGIKVQSTQSTQLKYSLRASAPGLSPRVSNIEIHAYMKIDNKKVILKLSKLSKFNNAEGEVVVDYNNALGSLTGWNGAEVESFSVSFLPHDVVKKVNPAVAEYVHHSMQSEVSYRHIGTVSAEIEADTATHAIDLLDIVITKVNNVNP